MGRLHVLRGPRQSRLQRVFGYRFGQGGMGAKARRHLQDRAGPEPAPARYGDDTHGVSEMSGLHDEVESVAFRYQYVDHDSIGPPMLDDAEAFIDRFGGHDLVIHALQHVLQMATHQGVVLDDADLHAQPPDVSSLKV